MLLVESRTVNSNNDFDIICMTHKGIGDLEFVAYGKGTNCILIGYPFV